MSKPRIRHGLTLSALAIAALALTGCSAPASNTADASSAPAEQTTAPEPAAAERSTAEACTVLQEELTKSATVLQESMTELTTDPDAAVTALEDFNTSLNETIAGLGNDEVATAASGVSDYFGTLTENTKILSEDPTNADAMENLQTLIADSATMADDLSAVCS